ncbi:MAG: SMP-30/gluconolactonase/LRE family protein [Thermodesulfobacteriota bacterium]
MFEHIVKLKRRIHKSFYKGQIKSSSEHFYRLIPKNTRIKKVASGFKFTEGPVWIQDGNYLLFSDIPANKIYRLNRNGNLEIFREPSNNSNGLTLDGEKRLIACEHKTRRVTRTENNGSINVLAESFSGKRLNSPNDVVVSKKGFIYFTDPPFGIKSEAQEQKYSGVYFINPETLVVNLLVDDFERPNGLAFSPDEKYLYIDDSKLKHIRSFEVKENGELKGGKIFYEFNEKLPGNPDGMKVDIEGNIYCAGPGGIFVINPTGNLIGKIVLPEIPSNCAWGDNDNKNLYITAQTSVYKIKTNITGYKPC